MRVVVLASLMAVAWCTAPVMAQRKYDPAACKADRKCIELSFNEYKTAMLQSFSFWRKHEGDLHAAIVQKNPTIARTVWVANVNARMSTPRNWSLPSQAQAAAAKIDMDEYEALDDCRLALLGLLHAFENLSEGNFRDVKMFQDTYPQLASRCERQFKLPQSTSKLRK